MDDCIMRNRLDVGGLQAVGHSDVNSESRKGAKAQRETKTAVPAADFLADAKSFFEDELLPITRPCRGPEGCFYLPPRLIEDYRKLLRLAKVRERGFVRMQEVLARLMKKVAELEAGY